MKWSYKIFRAFGIDVRIHITFIVLLALFALGSGGPMAALQNVFFVCLVFGIVVLHEFGHSLAAMFFGIPVRDITLLPIGGVAQIQIPPRRPLHEFIIAIAGPAVNVVLALAFGILSIPASLFDFLTANYTGISSLTGQLVWINVMLVVFNMIPALPMDGGRVLRSLLAFRMGYLPATRISVRIGQVICVILFIIGLTGGQPLLPFIAVFIFMASFQELYQAEMLDRASIYDSSQWAGSAEPFTGSARHFHDGIGQRRGGPFEHGPAGIEPDDLPLPDLQARYDDLISQGEDVTPVYSDGRIVGIIRRS